MTHSELNRSSKGEILEEGRKYLEALSKHPHRESLDLRGRWSLRLAESWTILNQRGHGNLEHSHGAYALSGAYYVSCGDPGETNPEGASGASGAPKPASLPSSTMGARLQRWRRTGLRGVALK